MTQVRRHRSGLADLIVVGIGASAGGLEACTRLLAGVPANSGIAFVLVQHLDPRHDSMLVGLLRDRTSMVVVEATQGMRLTADHLYVIPPGMDLKVSAGALRLSRSVAHPGPRTTFDTLLASIADDYGARAACVVLSGTGADGSVGLLAIKARHGLVIAQDPAEASHDGMPRAAIATGKVDHVLPAAGIAAALIAFGHAPASATTEADMLPAIIDLLRTTTAHDFSTYKPGTLQRRTEQRIAALGLSDEGAYLDLLRQDGDERDRLAKDLLINVTRFFRDPEIFALLADTVVPALLDQHDPAQPVRIWVAGCSTGEETYSLAIVFSERIAASGRDIKLQVFASDVDPDAVARARAGMYPATIEADVSAERLARFFTHADAGWRVHPDLRAAVVFTVQDLVADPPFSRLDFISCRNVLIYLNVEAQAKVLSLFHFALREGGVLLLGSAEIVPPQDHRFAVISKAGRIFRHVGRRRPGDLRQAMNGKRTPAPYVDRVEASRPPALADLARRLVLQRHAPAAVLVNRQLECLFTLGPVDRFLRVGPGIVTSDVLAMARHGLRAKLRVAVQAAIETGRWAAVDGARVLEPTADGAHATALRIEVEPARHAGEDLLLICFIAAADGEAATRPVEPSVPTDSLAGVRDELARALRELEVSAEDQRAAQEEALSVSEEYQSTNEELLTSKEELQSLNEELTALNSQLQETLEKQRTTSDDLQNVLYSTDVATLFLDRDLNIRFFTPTTRALFRVIASDIGRPLADLASLTGDADLAHDARAVLADATPVEREVEAADGVWFTRRVLPYRTFGGSVEGVVITFTDVTERKATARALEAARRQADLANAAKSRFLAAASHDLRQPLQALTLQQGLLATVVHDSAAAPLVGRMAGTIGAMSGMLDTLLDVNQIDAGVIRPAEADLAVADLLTLAHDEFESLAAARGLRLRCLPSSRWTRSDPALLAQMLRNLVANAIKYTRQGGVLIGCRPRGDGLSLEVWDTGIGIPDDKVALIFEEFRQLDSSGREPHRGLGLGLSIVDRLATLLGHRIRVASRPGRGSMFAIDLPIGQNRHPEPRPVAVPASPPSLRRGTILVAEDEPDLRDLLTQFLTEDGHSVIAAADGEAAIEAVAHAAFPPDLLMVDYNLSGGLTGLEVVARLRASFGASLAAIVLTGDIGTATLRAVVEADCVHLAKPVRLVELTAAIQALLSPAADDAQTVPVTTADAAADAQRTTPELTTHVVDDDPIVLAAIRAALETDGQLVETYPSGEAFLAVAPHPPGCLLLDAHLPGLSGLQLLGRLRDAGSDLPTVMITGQCDVAMAVAAMRAGAVDFVRKPVARTELLTAISRAMGRAPRSVEQHDDRNAAIAHLSGLTARQREVMDLVLAGHPNKNIAIDLGISQRTVENHRASIMSRTGSQNLPALVRTAMAAIR